MKFLCFSRMGQSALEFVILISFSLIVVSSLVVVFQNNITDMEKVREGHIVDQAYNLMLSELDFAMMSRPVYERTFYLPSTLGGYPYSIYTYDGVEVVITFLGEEHVRFLSNTTKVDGFFKIPGPNFLSKDCVDCPIIVNEGYNPDYPAGESEPDPSVDEPDDPILEEPPQEPPQEPPDEPITVEALLSSDLVAWYPFDSNANDYSDYNNHGIVHGASLISDGGIKGGAYEFDGENDHIAIANSPSLNQDYDAFTVSAWVKMHGAQHGNLNEGYIVIKSDWYLTGDAPYVSYVSGTGFRWRMDENAISLTHSGSANNWYHVVNTWDGTTAYLYINGELVDSNNHNSFTNDQGALSIGGSAHNPNYRPFWGLIDEVRIYNKSFSEEEVGLFFDYYANDYLDYILNSNLVAWYPFDYNANDLTGNGYDGAVLKATHLPSGGFDGGGAYNFSGALFEGINITNERDLRSETFTLSSWLYIYNNTKNNTIASQRYTENWRFGIRDNKKMIFSYRTDDGPIVHTYSSSDIQANNFYHVAVTYNNDKKTVKLYIDGELDAERTFDNGIYSTYWRSPFWIGAYGGGGLVGAQNINFEGIIDNVKYYNRAFTDSEVQTLHAYESESKLDNVVLDPPVVEEPPIEEPPIVLEPPIVEPPEEPPVVDGSVIFSLDFNHRPLGKYATRSEFIDDWQTSWGDRGHEFEVVRDPSDSSNKVGLLTFPFYDSSDFKWGCWSHPDCEDSEGRRIYFDEKPSFGNAFLLNGVGPSSGGGQWHVDLKGSYDEAYYSYRIKFSPNFDAVDGGKMPGGFYPNPRLCNSCEDTDCRDSDGSRCDKANQPCDGVADYFAFRHMFHKDNLIYYVYFADKKNLCGDSKSLSNSKKIYDENWHTVKVYFKLNDPDVHNGVIKTWIDDVETTSWNNIMFRTKDDRLSIGSFAISTFYGGGLTTKCSKTSSWDHQCNIGYIESWMQKTYDVCAEDPKDPCSDVLRYSNGDPYYFYAPRKTEYMYIDDIVVYT